MGERCQSIWNVSESNILHNAILYTQDRGKVEIHTAKTENGEAIIDIIDNGPGIPEAERTNPTPATIL